MQLFSSIYTFDARDHMLKGLFQLSPHEPEFILKFFSLKNFKTQNAVPKLKKIEQTNKRPKVLLHDYKKTNEDSRHLQEAYGYIFKFLNNTFDTNNEP